MIAMAATVIITHRFWLFQAIQATFRSLNCNVIVGDERSDTVQYRLVAYPDQICNDPTGWLSAVPSNLRLGEAALEQRFHRYLIIKGVAIVFLVLVLAGAPLLTCYGLWSRGMPLVPDELAYVWQLLARCCCNS